MPRILATALACLIAGWLLGDSRALRRAFEWLLDRAVGESKPKTLRRLVNESLAFVLLGAAWVVHPARTWRAFSARRGAR